MHEEKTEGIVLRAQDFKERHRIITLFTPQGLISLIVKNISRKNTRLLSLTTPFCHGEYHFRRNNSELLRFHDGSLIDEHLNLRQSYSTLQAAGALAHAVLTSQMPGKPSPALFVLYKSYHKQVPCFSDPAALLSSFYLKLLKYEGLLTIAPRCTHCDEAPSRLLYNGESLCTQHNVQGGLHFSPSEWETLLILDGAQQFSALSTLAVPPMLSQKITSLFHSRLTL